MISAPGRLAVPMVEDERQPAPVRFDPYWNHVPRAALFYTLPLLLLAVCLARGWAGASREFWVPLLFAFVAVVPATRRRWGKPFAWRDFQGRDRFPVTLALLPAGVWCVAINGLGNPALAAPAAVAVLLLCDALALRYELLSVYALGPDAAARAGRGLLAFSLPLWSYFALAMTAVHAVGRDTPAAIAAAALAVGLPVLALWTVLHRARAAPEKVGPIRRVAVVGGGWSGLYATKWLTEAGIEATCFEATDAAGGIWQYREDRPSGVARSTRVTSSKHFLHACDFPLPPSAPEFPHHSEVLAYLHSYIERFGLGERIRLGAEVTSVRKRDGRWRVVVAAGGETVADEFDAVVIASGPHQLPNVDPTRHPLYSRFTGRLIHSAEYKSPSDVDSGTRVLVVGAGESSADIVAEFVQNGAQVHWASRSGQWFADRNMGPFPADHITTQGTRVFAGLFGNLEYIVRRFVARVFVNLAWGRGGHGVVEWIPHAPYLHQFLNKSRDGVLEVYRGRAAAHRAPVRIEGREVRFEGEEEPVEVDLIVLATGYRPEWPFLEERGPRPLYKRVLDVDDPTLAFVGFARPIVGSIPSLSELQARWVAALWSGRVGVACRRRRQAELAIDRRRDRRTILDSSELRVLVDQELYATEIASLFGAQVRWLKLLLTWPRAFLTVLASPWVAFKYRLDDPDRSARRRALADIVREMPPPRAPACLLAVGIAIFVATLVAGAAALLRVAPLPVAVAVLGLLALAGTAAFRLSEYHGGPGDRTLTRLREIFPF